LNLYYYKCVGGNFGDDLNTWLWDELLPGWRDAWPDATLVGVGTIINDRLPQTGKIVIIGSGAGYGPLPPMADRTLWDIRAVRGPISAARLGLPPELAIVDPAALISDLPAFKNIPDSGQTIFVPHHTSVKRHDWERLCSRAGVRFVAPQGESRQVIREIAGARLVIAESMHAAIIADAFRRPWIAVSITGVFNTTKWQDWGQSIGVDPSIRRFFITDALISALRVIKRRSRIAGPAQSTPPIGRRSLAPQHPLLRLKLRTEEILAVRRLRSLSRLVGQQSPAAVLDRKKAGLRRILSNLRKEF